MWRSRSGGKQDGSGWSCLGRRVHDSSEWAQSSLCTFVRHDTSPSISRNYRTRHGWDGNTLEEHIGDVLVPSTKCFYAAITLAGFTRVTDCFNCDLESAATRCRASTLASTGVIELRFTLFDGASFVRLDATKASRWTKVANRERLEVAALGKTDAVALNKAIATSK